MGPATNAILFALMVKANATAAVDLAGIIDFKARRLTCLLKIAYSWAVGIGVK